MSDMVTDLSKDNEMLKEKVAKLESVSFTTAIRKC